MKNDNPKPDPYFNEGYQIINPFKKAYRFYDDMPGGTAKEKAMWFMLKCNWKWSIISATLGVSKTTIAEFKDRDLPSPSQTPEEFS